MADVSAVRYLAKRARRTPQSGLHVLQFSHAESLRQDSAACKRGGRKDFSEAARQNPVAMASRYREILRLNLRLLMRHHRCNADTMKARYLDGPKCGLFVSPRSVRNAMNVQASAPGLDIIAAVAARFALEPWQLLCPIRDPRRPPKLVLLEEEIRLVRQYEDLKRKLGPPAAEPDDDPVMS